MSKKFPTRITEFKGFRDIASGSTFARWANRAGLVLTLFLSAALSLSSVADPLPVPLNPADGRVAADLAARSMQVHQSLSRETFDWKQFNIDHGYRVDFNQPSASAIALNRIHQNDPSRIFGELNANGQVYLLNTNGFVFGSGSSVNTKTLIATTQNISDSVLQRGVTQVFSQDGSAALEPPVDANGNPLPMGNIVVEQGATITAGNQGQIILAAPKVVNAGTINANNGQAILAGAEGKVYLAQPDSDSGVRGLLVEVDVGGEATNLGDIIAGNGNATMIGFAVNQMGRVSATTTVDLDGQIRLLAREGGAPLPVSSTKIELIPSSTERATALNDGLGTKAKVTFGANSVTRIDPDPIAGGAATDGQDQPISSVQVMGHEIEMQSGSSIVVPSGEVEMIATKTPINFEPNTLPPNKVQTNRSAPLPPPNDTRIVLRSGSRIDVSGTTDAVVPMERNVVSVKLTANELRDSPLQKGGFLDGNTIWVDTRVGTPIADISAEVSKISRSLAERTSRGGTVSIVSEGDAVIENGAVIDLSGGSVRFTDGFLNTTSLITDDNRVVPIGRADPNLRYIGMLGEVEKEYAKWVQTLRWTVQGLEGFSGFEPGYVQGQPAGTFELIAPRVALDGSVIAGSSPSRRQLELGDIPFGGELYLNLARNINGRQSVRLVQHGNSAFSVSADAFLEDQDDPTQPAALELGDALFADSGLGKVGIITNGRVRIENSSNVRMVPGGELSIDAGSIEMAGTVDIRSGKLTLKTHEPSTLNKNITLEGSTLIDLSGGWVNNSPLFERARFDPIAIDGGSLEVIAVGDLVTEAGSLIDVRGGARITELEEFVAGRGGDVTLAAAGPQGSNLIVDGRVMGHSFERGGRLTLASNEIIVSDSLAQRSASDGLTPTVIRPALLEQSGFGAYTLRANIKGVTVEEGTEIRLAQLNRVFKEYDTQNSVGVNPSSLESGVDLGRLVDVRERPQFERIPVDLRLELALSQVDSSGQSAVNIEPGAAIRTDPGAHVELISESNINFDGLIEAPSGTVDFNIVTQSAGEPGFLPSQAISLGPDSAILARGVAKLVPDPTGRLTGSVLPGGSVNVTANRGFVIFEPGALIDVSGTSTQLDLPILTQEAVPGFHRTTVASDAGSIAFTTSEGGFLDGRLVGRAESAYGAAGGQLSVRIDQFLRGSYTNPDLPPNARFPIVPTEIRVQQGMALTLPSDFQRGDAVPRSLDGVVQVNQNTLQSSGFESLALFANDRISLQDGVDLSFEDSLVLDAPRIQTAGSGIQGVSLSASFLQIGSSQLDRSTPLTPAPGNGRLDASANLIDLIGITALEGFKDVYLTSSGDIRARGTRIGTTNFSYTGQFTVDGNLTLKADQIYPTTLSDFEISLQGGSSSVLTILPNDAPVPVLSAAGRLALDAPTIVQKGVLKAPLGSIELNAADRLVLGGGSRTVVSAEYQLIPFGRVQGGLNWVYPLPGNRFIAFDTDPSTSFSAPPEKRIQLNAANIDFQQGAEINADGGGDLFAFEVVRGGPGGSRDVLDPLDPDVVDGLASYEQKFAILPGLQNGFAPYDHLETPSSGLKPGDSVFLTGVDGLATGNYVLLPAHYALLPGAMLITPVAGTQDIIPGLPLTRLDGAPITAGYRFREGTNNRDARLSGFAVQAGSVVRTLSDFIEYNANQFFADKANASGFTVPRIPMDAGLVSINTRDSLNLGGTLLARPEDNGRGGQLDIVAKNLAVVANPGSLGPGVVEIDANQLNRLDVASLLLGGTRKRTLIESLFPNVDDPTRQFIGSQYSGIATAAEFVSGADTVTVGNGASLNFAETILIAKDRVTVESGATISASQRSDRIDHTTVVRGSSALVRVTNDHDATFARTQLPAVISQGSVTVESGAILDSGQDGSILIDAPFAVTLDGMLTMEGGSLALSTSTIDLGAAKGTSNALLLNSRLLDGLAVDSLYLNGLSQINFVSDFGLGSPEMDIDLSAPRFAGFGAVGDTFSITAKRFTIANRSSRTAGAAGTGSGEMSLLAQRVEFADGSYSIDGFGHVGIVARSEVTGVGESSVRIAADTDLSTPLWLASQNASNTQIDASGHRLNFLGIASAGNGDSAIEAAFGASLTAQADSLSLGTRLLLPSGKVDLHALTGDLNIQPGTELDVGGRFLQIGQAFGQAIGFTTPAGDVVLSADAGNLFVASGASINLSNPASNTFASGSLVLRSPLGSTQFDGELKTPGGVGADLFSLEADSFGPGGFSALAAELSTTRFERLAIRQNSGDLVVGTMDSLSAKILDLEAATGSIEVSGVLNASTAEAGGNVRLVAGDRILLGASASITAKGLNGVGGRVHFEAWDRDADGLGGLQTDPAASIDLSGTLGGGELHVSVSRTDSDGDGQDDSVDILGPVGAIGATSVTVEGVRVYNRTAINAADIALWQTETSTYMANAQGTLGSGVELIPGIVVASAGDLSLNAAWNFLPSAGSGAWRYNGSPGVLTLLADGNININQSISDGFAAGSLNTIFGSFPINDQLQSDRSWSYRFEALGDFNLAASRSIRTGSGDIEVRAAGNINYGDGKSSIYSAGRQTTQTVAVDLNDPTSDLNGNPLSAAQIANNPYGSFSEGYAAFLFYAEYPVDGGNVLLRAGGNINGVQTNQFINEWLVRTGNWKPVDGINGFDIPTAWGIAISQPATVGLPSPGFHQSIGAFGGGNVTVDAGGDIKNLSVVLPTTGKQTGSLSANANPAGGVFVFNENKPLVTPSGDLRVDAGRDIVGGLYYTGSGNALIRAGAKINPGGNNLGVLLAMDDAQFRVQARGDLAVSGIFNPSVLPQANATVPNLFFQYGADSAVSLQSVAADLVWKFDLGNFQKRYPSIRFNATNNFAQEILTPRVQFTAGRDVRIDSGLKLFPSPSGQLQLVAGRDITKTSNSTVVVLEPDTDPAFLPNLFLPATNDADLETRLSTFGSPDLIHAVVPLHRTDTEPSLIAAGRDITSESSFSLTFSLAEPAVVSAGRDLTKNSYRIQNLRENDTTLVQAGGSIRFPIALIPETGAVQNQQFDLEVSGPGRFYLLSGGDLDLGASRGISSIGNLRNPFLPDGGADIYVLAGIQGYPDLKNFQRIYLEDRSDYHDLLIDYLGGDSNFDLALSTFLNLSQEERLPLLLDIFFKEIRAGGREGAASQDRSDYVRGDRAISALFPDGENYDGDVRLFFSKIHTIDDGDINLLVPGGEINAGLAVAFSGRKEPAELGIVAQKRGDINIFVRDDLQVNTSRVATFGGGDILAWSELANIDAGRGARSSVTIPPPITTINAQGQIETTFSPAVSVSGIQAATTRDGDQGNVDLFAPNGVIDAGIAGIAGADVTVGATAILNANNISFSGSSVGVPVGQTTSIAAGLGGVSNLAATTSKIADATSKTLNDSNQAAAPTAGLLKVEFLGYETRVN